MAVSVNTLPDFPSFRIAPPPRERRVEDYQLSDGTPMVGADGLLIPAARSFSAIYNASTRIYSSRFDEAMRDNFVAARAMRRDAFLEGLFEERIGPTINRTWHLEIDDDDDPVQRMVADELTKIVQNIPDFDQFKRANLDAVWFGRSGTQWAYARMEELNDQWGFRRWDPLHGDSIQYTFDGVPAILLDGLTTSWYADHGAKWGQDGDLRPTDRGGNALVLQRPYWRNRFSVHSHIRRKADYFEGELAGSVQGLGLRGQVYWQYVLRSDALTWMITYMQAVGAMDLLVFNFPAGNSAAQKQQEANANKIIGKAAIAVPRNPTGNWQGVEQVQMNSAGMEALHKLVADYFDRHIERLFVGQSMSSGADKGDGLGGTGRSEFAKATKDELITADTNRLDNTLSYDLIRPLKEYNYPWAKFPVRFKSIMPDLKAEEKVQSGKVMISLGQPIKTKEMYAAADFSKPKDGDEIIVSIMGGPPMITTMGPNGPNPPPMMMPPPGMMGPPPMGGPPPGMGPPPGLLPGMPPGMGQAGPPVQLSAYPSGPVGPPNTPQGMGFSRYQRRHGTRYMTSEEDFHRMLDENPDDHQTRQIFADWLQERNDPRAEGYRALGKLGKRALGGDDHSWTHLDNSLIVENHPEYAPRYRPHALPSDWYGGIQTNNHYGQWKEHATRREAEDAAAHAFSRLPEERRAAILNPEEPTPSSRYDGGVGGAPGGGMGSGAPSGSPAGFGYPGGSNTYLPSFGGRRHKAVQSAKPVPRGIGFTRPTGYADELDPQEHGAFQQKIDENPFDAHTHRVFADWLQDRGHDDEAAFRRSVGDWMHKRGAMSPPYLPHRGSAWAYPWQIQYPHPSQEEILPEGVTSNGTGPWNDEHLPTRASGGQAWGDYRGMENALRRSFMENLRQRRQQPAEPEPTESSRFSRRAFSRYVRENRCTPYSSDVIGKKLTPDEQNRARRVDLVVLPADVRGTNCGSCMYARRAEGDKLDCTHHDVRLPVSDRLCCALWDRSGTKHVGNETHYRRPVRYAEPQTEHDAWLARNMGDWHATLDPEEAKEVANWKESPALNTRVRLGVATPDDERRMSVLDRAIAKGRTREPVTVHRGLYDAHHLKDVKPGDVIEHPSFVATSVDPEYVHGGSGKRGFFGGNGVPDENGFTGGYDHPGNVVMQLHVPAGTSAGHPAGKFEHEKELILPRGGQVRVHEVRPFGKGKHIIGEFFPPSGEQQEPSQASRYERRNAPPGGVEYGEGKKRRKYRSGMFIPGGVMFTHTPKRPDPIENSQPDRRRGAPYAGSSESTSGGGGMRDDISDSATHEGLPHILAAISPSVWRGHHGDVTPRLAASDYLRALGREQEADLLADTTKHAYRHEGGIHSAHDLARERHAITQRPGHGAASNLMPDEAQMLGTALWSSTDDAGNPLDDERTAHDIHPSTMAAMLADYRHFKDTSGYNLDQTSDGHHFWLSRNGHGTGFLDADDWSPEQREEMHQHAQRQGEYNLYVGDDGDIHGDYEVHPTPDEPEPPTTASRYADTDPEIAHWEAKLRQLHADAADELERTATEARAKLAREMAHGLPENHLLVTSTQSHLSLIDRHIADRRRLAQGLDPEMQYRRRMR